MLAVAAFSVAWWLGLYLAGRDPADPTMSRAGLGLVSYALALALSVFDGTVVDAVGYVLAGLPALIWAGVLIALLPAEDPYRAPADRLWRWTILPLGVAELTAAAVVGGWWEPLTAVLVLLPLALALVLLLRSLARGPVGLRQGVVVLASLLFALGAVAVLVPFGWLPDGFVLASVGIDLVVLGVVVAVTNALEAGEALGADLRRSAVGAGLVAVVFGGQVGLVSLAVDDGSAGGALRALAFGVVGAAIAVVTLANSIQRLLDRVAFAGTPDLRSSRAELRDAADALPRRDEDAGSQLASLDDEAFTRLVRDALRHYGDLGKLVSSPLLALPVVDARLAGREAGREGNPLDRATELKALLLESIERLRPRDASFGTSEEWRHFNALYFPYVAGIRPYRRQPDLSGLDDVSRRAFDWLRRYVPERTLYNWQNAAARVVARDLRARVD